MDCGDSAESNPNRISLDLRWIQQYVAQVRNATCSSEDEISIIRNSRGWELVLSQNCMEFLSKTQKFWDLTAWKALLRLLYNQNEAQVASQYVLFHGT